MSSIERISVVIPTLNAGPWLPALFARLATQTPVQPSEILLVDSGSRDATPVLAARQPGVRCIPVARFTHGRARNLGVHAATGKWVVLMTQDALPVDDAWLAALLAPLRAQTACAVYARQIPRPDAPPLEQWFLETRFPAAAAPAIRTHSGVRPPGYPQTFFSNVCSAAHRDTWRRFPFDETLIMSEDQQFARDVLCAGLAIAYQPRARVLHSHAYSARETFRRYFDTVVAFRQISPHHGWRASAGLGAGDSARALLALARRRPRALPGLLLHTACKAAGTAAGLLAHRLPRSICARCSQQPGYWTSRNA